MKVNKRNISRVLRDCTFSPQFDPVMKVIVDVGNPRYYINRAIEELKRVPDELPFEDKRLTTAIQLIVLAKIGLQYDED